MQVRDRPFPSSLLCAAAPPSADPHRDLLIALNATPQLSRDAVCRLSARPESWSGAAPDQPLDALAQTLGVSAATLRTALETVPAAAGLRARQETLASELDADIVTRRDPDYPRALLDLELPPPVLYRRGRMPPEPAIAVVGSRLADAYGLEAAQRFASELAASGLVVVSGFARGIDTAAHRAAVGVPGGRTVAVLGCGLDIDYPRGNRRLAARIPRRGALLTEFAPGFAPRPENFPVRNRIIAALSLGTLVVRATPRSGSLITARLALELGRDVYAVPGSVFEKRARGPHALIQDGALLVQRTRDIVESLPLEVRERLEAATEEGSAPAPPATAGARELLARLRRGSPQSPETLAAKARLPIDTTLALLLELEIAGWARRYPGPAFTRIDPDPGS